MTQDKPMTIEITLSNGGLDILNHIIDAGMDQTGVLEGDEDNMEDVARVLDQLRGKATTPKATAPIQASTSTHDQRAPRLD